jgi:hypothetical protein
MHPEDCVFDGKKSVKTILEILKSCMDYDNKFENTYSIKYDGAPAIVFGTDVNNGRFFVGTKSVFNKGIKKICYTNDCIDYYYPEQTYLNTILKECLKYLPRVSGIYQGDFIGFGDRKTTEFTPNAITYKFDNAPFQNIIMAIHTMYIGDEFDIMVALPDSGIMLPTNEGKVLFLNTIAEQNTDDRIFQHAFRYTYSAIIDTLEIIYEFPKFRTKAAKARVLKLINSYIRDGRILNAEDLAKETGIDCRIFELYVMITQLKEIVMNRFKCAEGYNTNVRAYLSNKEIDYEGIVVSHVNHWQRIVLKLVKRYEFSRYNFTSSRFAKTNDGTVDKVAQQMLKAV